MQPVRKELYCDLCIVGGGVGGCAAAIEAARKGLHVILVEKGVSLGGLATNGYVPQIAGGTEGICLEFAKELEKRGHLRKLKVPGGPEEGFYRNSSFEPEHGKFVLEDMLMSAGARVLYDATCFDVDMDGEIIREAFFHTKGGVMGIKAEMYIDATGDADVAAMANVPCEIGGQDFAGLNISSTLGSRWSGANLTRYYEEDRKYRKKQADEGAKEVHPLIYDLECQWIEEGKLVRHVANKFSGFFAVIIPPTTLDNADFATFSFHSYYCHNTDCEDITRQVLEQHQLMKGFEEFLRNAVPGFENVRLVGTGSLPGARESRRIYGEYMLKAADVCCGTKFEDGIARFPEMLDTHHPTNSDLVFMRHFHMKDPKGSAVTLQGFDPAYMHPLGHPEGVQVRPSPADWCDIPYRSIVPKVCDNLFVVGRCCSAEFHANGAMRIIGPSMGTGHAAGLASYVAISEKVRPRDIDGRVIRQMLIAEGVPLDQPTDEFWEFTRKQAEEGEFFINPGDAISTRPKKD
ncbi:MAG: FAD-dependent oxidoreductase [Eubacterium sp.]|nr:FAD-dependent oxidoreductase [Eubacterium sp.]